MRIVAVDHTLLKPKLILNTMVASDTKIIDGRDHLYGRLCSIVAKELLAGQKIVIVRCDEICISGSRESSLRSILPLSFSFT